ncbi:hypothetical protein QBC35DRAFT_500335 [Podospora australis]|uniref:Uncharacterized protein n=1 Tax=Podospora australis TaxID=1536484 RepID=A0AAN6WSN6_9PEZI|nr:hypothetical protein QBC35DRAFT_500335 [Podospora australis]
MAEVVGFAAAVISITKTASTTCKACRTLRQIAKNAPNVEKEMKTMAIDVRSFATAIEGAGISLQRNSSKDSAKSPAIMYMIDNNLPSQLRAQSRVIRGRVQDFHDKIEALYDRLQDLPKSWGRLWTSYKWHRLKPLLGDLRPEMESFKSTLILVMHTIALETLHKLLHESKVPSPELIAQIQETERAIQGQMETIRDLKEDLKDVIMTATATMDESRRQSHTSEQRFTTDQHLVLCHLAENLIRRGTVPTSPPPINYKIPRLPKRHRRLSPSRRSRWSRMSATSEIGRHSVVQPPFTPPPSAPTTPTSTAPVIVSPWDNGQPSPPPSPTDVARAMALPSGWILPRAPSRSSVGEVIATAPSPSSSTSEVSLTRGRTADDAPEENNGMVLAPATPDPAAIPLPPSPELSEEVVLPENTPPQIPDIELSGEVFVITGTITTTSRRGQVRAKLDRSLKGNCIDQSLVNRLGLSIQPLWAFKSNPILAGDTAVGINPVGIVAMGRAELKEATTFVVCKGLKYPIIFGVKVSNWLEERDWRGNGLHFRRIGGSGGTGSMAVEDKEKRAVRLEESGESLMQRLEPES